MHVLKKINWKACGVQIVAWELRPVPSTKSENEFARVCEVEGWQVVGKDMNIKGEFCLFLEKPAGKEQSVNMEDKE